MPLMDLSFPSNSSSAASGKIPVNVKPLRATVKSMFSSKTALRTEKDFATVPASLEAMPEIRLERFSRCRTFSILATYCP